MNGLVGGAILFVDDRNASVCDANSSVGRLNLNVGGAVALVAGLNGSVPDGNGSVGGGNTIVSARNLTARRLSGSARPVGRADRLAGATADLLGPEPGGWALPLRGRGSVPGDGVLRPMGWFIRFDAWDLRLGH